MNSILDRYGELLNEVDAWFARSVSRYPENISCHKGCSACCRGLFDITLMDALYLKRGFDMLSGTQKKQISAEAAKRLHDLSVKFPDFVSPWFLNHLPSDILAAMMPEDDPTPCLLLSAEGNCLVYEHRPMTCRLNGIPLYGLDAEPFSDEWCTLNFTDVDPSTLTGLRHCFSEVFTHELLLFRELTLRLYGEFKNELDTIIPAAVYGVHYQNNSLNGTVWRNTCTTSIR